MSALEGFKNSKELRLGWYKRAATVAVGHYKSAESLTSWHRWLSGVSVVLSAVVGTAVFASLQARPEPWMQVVAGLMSVAAAALAGLASSTGFVDRAERHRVAAAKYNAIGRELEQMLLLEEVEPAILNSIRNRLDELSADLPHIPKRIHNEISTDAAVERWGDQRVHVSP